jgi:hypothetical protein
MDKLIEMDGWIEDEEFHCEKCGKVFSLRIQNTGEYDYDEGAGCCEKCYKFFCEICGNWHIYGGRYKRICETCFNEEMLDSFSEWYDIFEDEYCDRQCDDCPFFFKKGCMMILLKELVDMAFHTTEIKQRELERIQKRNREAVKKWEDELREAGAKPSQKRSPNGGIL